jgi:uncharacterized membrane protein
MTSFETIVKLGMLDIATAIEAVGGLVIAIAAAKTVLLSLSGLIASRSHGDQTVLARASLGYWLSFALEFEVAADILRTAVEPSWNDIGQLSAVIVLRTALNYVIRSESRPPERIRIASR